MLMLGLETDGIKCHCWRSSEVLFVLFYCYELSVRIYHMGPTALAQAVSWEASFVVITDCGLVLLSLGNLIYILCVPDSMPAWMLYTRLVRGLRVFFLFDSLHRFATALSEMLSTLLWIFGVLTFTVYLVAVFLTHYAKNRLFLAGNNEEYFESILKSMFTLFQVTTMDSWPDIAAPLVEHSDWWRVFFVIFIAFSAWTMISLVTAVVSDNVIQATQDRKEKQKEAQERRRKEFVEFLKVCFVNADTDGNQVLDHEEFATLIKDQQVVAKMEDLGVTLPLQELEKAFSMLDVDEDGELSIDEFTSGLSQLQETLNTKHVVSLDYGLQRVSTQVTKRLEHLENHVTERSDAIARSVDKLTAAVEELSSTLKGWRQDASTTTRDSKRLFG
ncbi:Catsper1 [Symbiodinium natans]|uniref:Catsper1 protein n=1 Tax=Symbiodinium natans TaxID=878477 RepID=A0A812UU02_9DINO|nr:Catsper1 [Symbiodinium natans]